MAKKDDVKKAIAEVHNAIKNLDGKKLTKKEKEEAKRIMDEMNKSMMEFFDKAEKNLAEKKNGQK